MVEISVCIGTSCHVNGSYNVVQTFQQMIEEYSLHDKVDFKAYFCMKECQKNGVSVSVDGTTYRIETVEAGLFFKETILKRVIVNQS
ncbi:(2Fe-2S) ferredoxin domain-containing protein [Mobilitalea sibirica]|uniref:(2Fe-2S) ferredoxin domain-containing protein n=1 Tax=Mobilitalea sibirica TaxID=1462919 RepID=A0A8J7HBQ0_9FIRM|nr:(2Fe-2S) ferredoxin domain-containing protein [Mobilitalea sibirica]MBH1939484.1 (2Fe-2S) ferredoxin domain-containing protein [Mobilitalea sibirica]